MTVWEWQFMILLYEYNPWQIYHHSLFRNFLSLSSFSDVWRWTNSLKLTFSPRLCNKLSLPSFYLILHCYFSKCHKKQAFCLFHKCLIIQIKCSTIDSTSLAAIWQQMFICFIFVQTNPGKFIYFFINITQKIVNNYWTSIKIWKLKKFQTGVILYNKDFKCK